MINNIKVSVIMAVYNAEQYLIDSLESVICQSLREIEIICVNDGSTDHTLEILREYEKKDDRIIVLEHNEKTDGAAAARNMGLRIARGEYLSFLDADDFFESNMLELSYERAKNDNSDVVIFDAFVYDDRLKCDSCEPWVLNHLYFPNENPFKPIEIKNHLFRLTLGAAWNCLFRTDLIRKEGIVFESINHTDDMVFVYMSFCNARIISILDIRLMHYRKNNANSQSTNAHLHPEAAYMGPLVLMRKLKSKGLYDEYKYALSELALDIARWHMCRITEWKDFRELYYALKYRYFYELGISNIPDELIEPSDIMWKSQVLSLGPEEYMLKNYLAASNEKYMNNIPDSVRPGSKVLIYGAGVLGKEIFFRVSRAALYNIVGWVDRDYKNKGWPIQSIETINEYYYDYILVTVRNGVVFDSIKGCLIEMGVPKDKIVWVSTI